MSDPCADTVTGPSAKPRESGPCRMRARPQRCLETAEPALSHARSDSSRKLHLATPGSSDTLCGLRVASVAVGLYTAERDERTGRMRAAIASLTTGRVERSCKGCLALYRGRCLAALIVA